MFEKEAAEHANTKYPIHRYWTEIELARNCKYEEGFKDGAEFGFQKGKNEWHDLQKDPNDLPEETEFIESDVLILLVQLRGTEHKRYELGRYIFSENVFSYSHLKDIEDVIAWKEIIPQKQEE